MLQVYKNKEFNKWAKKQGISDKILYDAALEVNSDLVEANLGGNIFKKRIALRNQGKSGGARSIIAFKKNNRLFYIYGFKKNDKANITPQEEIALKELADFLLKLNEVQISKLIKDRKLFLLEV